MPRIAKKGADPVKMTPAVMRKRMEEMEEELNHIKEGAYCYLCDQFKPKDRFYVSTDPLVKSGVSRVCRQCLKDIALRKDSKGRFREPTKESVIKALSYLDRPFFNALWNASINESLNKNTGRAKHNVWTAYVKNSAMPQYATMTFKDSDTYDEDEVVKNEKDNETEVTEESMLQSHKGQDTYDSYAKNRFDVIRLLDYDPFEKEILADKPFLYSQLLGMLDQSGEANEDMMRISAAITITRSFLQANKIDDTLVGLMGDVSLLEQNSATIKSLQESKAKIMSTIKDLAAENCLSLKNSKTVVKGSETWTGKVKKIRDLDLRDGRFNGFDLATCRGMQQVQEISDASIMKQLALDESEWSDIVAEMRVDNITIRKERDQYKEINRILLQENLDLKDYLEEKGIPIEKELKDLKDIYSIFAEQEDVIDEQEPPSE